MKRFSDQPETAKRVDFELSFWKGGKEYPLHFHAYRRSTPSWWPR
jgi:hypothetical protein